MAAAPAQQTSPTSRACRTTMSPLRLPCTLASRTTRPNFASGARRCWRTSAAARWTPWSREGCRSRPPPPSSTRGRTLVRAARPSLRCSLLANQIALVRASLDRAFTAWSQWSVECAE
eukprot:3698966-Prymnesium_polylepis.1